MKKAPEKFETERLLLRKPKRSDVKSIFNRYASDPEVTRYLGWPRHESVSQTRNFIEFSNSEWDRWPAGPYLAFLREDKSLLGATGFSFETPYRAQTGYVFAKDAWGKGYATEALEGIVEIAKLLNVRRLYATCHTEHRRSARVLEKCGFMLEGILRKYSEFPNLEPDEPVDVLCYAIILSTSKPGGKSKDHL
jgi:ribosomal-protein-alanine N-acetyltransferase